MQLGGAADRCTMEHNCKPIQTYSWGEQLAAVQRESIVNLIDRAVGKSRWPPHETCSCGEQLVALRWKTIAKLIKHAVAESSWPPYDGKEFEIQSDVQLGRAVGRRTLENNCESNQTCRWGEQLAAVRRKTIVNLIKHAVGESIWPPYNGKHL